jgi:hypothetical protein
MHYILSSTQDAKETNPNIEIRNRLVWNFVIFDHLKLFRISDFEFRIFNRACARRPLYLCASYCDLVAALPRCVLCGQDCFLLAVE